MAGITEGILLIGGTPIQNIVSVLPDFEGDLAEARVGNDGIEFFDKTPIPQVTIEVFKTDDKADPDWAGFNGQLLVYQETGGDRYDYAGIKLKNEGGYKVQRDGTETKTVVFIAKSRVVS